MAPNQSSAARRRVLAVAGLFFGAAAVSSAELTFAVSGDSAMVVGCSIDAIGPIEIPATFDGKPVTSIGERAFEQCDLVTRVVVPAGVSSLGDHAFFECDLLRVVELAMGLKVIGDYVFNGCEELALITLPAGVRTIGANSFQYCDSLRHINLPATLDSIAPFTFCESGLTTISIPQGMRIVGSGAFLKCDWLFEVHLPDTLRSLEPKSFSGCERLQSVTIPSSVESIGDYAFSDCERLREVTLPSGLASIGAAAFSDCTALVEAAFAGNAPSLGNDVFKNTDPTFTVSYLAGMSGFTSPTWEGWPARAINEGRYPAASWLLSHSFLYGSDLSRDPNWDGVNLLMAYALDLDPRLDLRSRLPVPVRDGEAVRMTFYGARPGITYSVETSEDLHDWGREGVILSEPDAEGLRSAVLDRSSPRRFMRLVVEK